MTDNITRKKNTGEPGNGGQFGSKTNEADDIDLATYVNAAAKSHQKSEKAMQLGSAAAIGRMLSEQYKGIQEVHSFAPIVEEDGEGGHWVAGVNLYDEEGEPVKEIHQLDHQEPTDWQEKLFDYAQTMGTQGANSWFSTTLGDGDPFSDKVIIEKAVAWRPSDD